MQDSTWWVDNAAHRLHCGGCSFPCDRDVEALAVWQGHALLLSSDTDCLSLWDAEGLIRTARVGVFPQDLAVEENQAWICGGADGRLHRLDLPQLTESADYPLPGMPERLTLLNGTAYVLTLLPEPEVHTALLRLDLHGASPVEITRFPGLPGCITADAEGLWVGVSEMVLHLPWKTDVPDVMVEGIGLARHFRRTKEGLFVTDSLEGKTVFIRV